MKHGICVLACTTMLFLSTAVRADGPGRELTPSRELAHDLLIDPNVPIIFDVSFPQALDKTLPAGQQTLLTVAGQLHVPNTYLAAGSPKAPAVVIVHGSAGIDSRNRLYADALNLAGIATLEIDLWAARGYVNQLDGAPPQRPGLPPSTLPDAFGALEFLAKQPYIDATRIGITGFSWGGVVSMLTATTPYAAKYEPDGLLFVGHAPNYPVCWAYNVVPGLAFSSFTGAPVLIQAGDLDAYDFPYPNACPNLVASLSAANRAFIKAKLYRGATHAWDRLQPSETVTDRFSHSGAGGQVTFVPNRRVAKQSREATVNFFKTIFGL